MAHHSPASTSTNDVSQKPAAVHELGESPALRRKSTNATAPLAIENVNAKLANPLAAYTHAELQDMGESYARSHGMEDLVEEFKKVIPISSHYDGIHACATVCKFKPN